MKSSSPAVAELRAHIAKDFVAPRVQHGFLFGQFARVFVFAHRRMVGGQLADGAVPDQVEARIAHVADGDLAVFHHRQGEHARHAAPIFARCCASSKMRLLARVMAVRTRSSGARHRRRSEVRECLHGGLGRQFAGGLAAHAIHHQEDAALGIDPVAVFVALAQQAGVGGGARQFMACAPSRGAPR